MGPKLERLRRVLTTLLIDYSEEEIEAELAAIPSNYKKLTRKHYSLMPSPEKVYIKVKGTKDGNSAKRTEPKQPEGFKGARNNTRNRYKW